MEDQSSRLKENMEKLVVFVAVVVSLGITVQGAVFFNELETRINEYGTERYCTYEGKRYGVGSRFLDFDSCVKCVCNKHGLQCSTTTFAVHVEGEEHAKCKNVVNNCKNRWVMKDDVTQRCPKSLMPKEIAMVGK